MKRAIFILFGILSLSLGYFHGHAQAAKKPVKLSVSYLRINDLAPELKALVKIKSGKKFEPAEGLAVQFFMEENSKQTSLGSSLSNRKGVASIEVPATVVSKLDSASALKVTAEVSESDSNEGKTAEIEVTAARIELTPTEKEGMKKVDVKLLALKDGKWGGVGDAEIKVFVRRKFSDLYLTDKALTTGADGTASTDIELKTPIPGDARGYMILGAKVEDSDTYGTVETLKYVPWGTPLKSDNSFFARSLWGTRDRTPVWLLIFPNVIIAIVWGLIAYMLFLIYRIRKEGLKNETN